MSIKEQFYSRSIHITQRGTILTTNYKINDGDLAFLPLIGEEYSAARPDLVCQDIQSDWIDNENNEVRITWTTRNAPVRQALADKTTSTHERWSFSTEAVDGESFKDQVDDISKSWNRIYNLATLPDWAASTGYDAKDNVLNDNNFYTALEDHTSSIAGATGDEPGVGDDWETKWKLSEPEVPQLTIFKPRIVLNWSVHVSVWEWPVMRELIGTVNDRDYLKSLVIAFPNTVREITYDLDADDDTGHWLFSGADIDPVGNKDVRVNMTFVYSFQKWNEPEGLPAGDANIYPTANFNLLPQPTDPDNSQNNDIGRTP